MFRFRFLFINVLEDEDSIGTKEPIMIGMQEPSMVHGTIMSESTTQSLCSRPLQLIRHYYYSRITITIATQKEVQYTAILRQRLPSRFEGRCDTAVVVVRPHHPTKLIGVIYLYSIAATTINDTTINLPSGIFKENQNLASENPLRLRVTLFE